MDLIKNLFLQLLNLFGFFKIKTDLLIPGKNDIKLN